MHGSPDGRFVNPVNEAGSSFTYTYVVMGTSNVTTASSVVATASPLIYLANGVEVVVPELEFGITAYYPPASIDAEYMKNLTRKTGRTNDGEWLGFAEGEVLYMRFDW